MVVAPFLVGVITALIALSNPHRSLTEISPTLPVQGLPVPTPVQAVPAPIPVSAFPEPTVPPRASNLVLSSGEGMDGLLSTVEFVLKFTNEERLQRGLTPLGTSAALAFVAQNHAENMCDGKILEDESSVFPDGWRTLDERLKLVGLDLGSEHLACERRQKPESCAKWMVMKWIASDNLRLKILNPAWQYVGVGICPASATEVYATQVFSDKPGSIR